MKIIFLTLCLLMSTFLFSQSQQEYLSKAENAIGNAQFNEATNYFKMAFEINESNNYYDYYYGALAAVQSQEDSLAMKWLRKAAHLGLGTKADELDYISQQKEFLSLHSKKGWSDIITIMNSKMNTQIRNEEMSREKWLAEIYSNKVKPNSYHLKFIDINGTLAPYIIYYPSNYSKSKSFPLITYLHGGYGTQWYYQSYTNPDIKKEPIFHTADELGAILIYPFARKNLNWVDSEKALVAIQKIVRQSIHRLNIDQDNIIIGGMSTGGKAAYWFAQKNMPESTGFFSFSGFPSLEFLDIDLNNLSKPFISVHSRYDELFKIEDITEIHDHVNNKYWQLKIIDGSDHGFIYDTQVNGPQILTENIKQLIY